ncbi:uncharacterized protein CLUP02_17932 [Colletotrichum lupini]|uniref:Uncharacterized protein n=1 Tax=Colletotrichum lupini TaxID=145971 RepID=A0A9Q8WAR9_9PEZI|nr:uncharacterized protein CLUP02_17932 [Colletotrichum lupini]UQC76419.1 hypothetical protein CLUP02_17932 [Colletotrichum lupini]
MADELTVHSGYHVKEGEMSKREDCWSTRGKATRHGTEERKSEDLSNPEDGFGMEALSIFHSVEVWLCLILYTALRTLSARVQLPINRRKVPISCFRSGSRCPDFTFRGGMSGTTMISRAVEPYFPPFMSRINDLQPGNPHHAVELANAGAHTQVFANSTDTAPILRTLEAWND